MKSTGDYGMVLQFAGKGSLRDYLSRNFESLDWVHKIRLARDVASGVNFIHEDNICHHDLHSRNVLIDHTGRALITDFGLSRYVNHANSNNGVRGVVPYISPERLRNSPFDKSSDVYSFGVIMWELTSGHPPFDRDGENFLLPFQIMRGRREEIVPGTPVAYSNLYQRCWDGEPYNRAKLPEVLIALSSMLSETPEEYYVATEGPPYSWPRTTVHGQQGQAVGSSAPIPRLLPPDTAPKSANVGPLVPKRHLSKTHSSTVGSTMSVDNNTLDTVLPGGLGGLKITGGRLSDVQCLTTVYDTIVIY